MDKQTYQEWCALHQRKMAGENLSKVEKAAYATGCQQLDADEFIDGDEEFGRRELGMTPEQWEQFQRHTRGFGDQDENGVDLSLLRENLRLTPTERLEKHHQTLLVVQEIRRAGRAAQLRCADSDASCS